MFLYAVPVGLTVLQQPTGTIRVGNSLKLFCNISIGIQVPNITRNDIHVSATWTKTNQSSFTTLNSTGRFNITHDVIDSGRLYSSILQIDPLIFSDSARYNCTATISPRISSMNLFNITKQSSTIDVLLSKCRPFFYC